MLKTENYQQIKEMIHVFHNSTGLDCALFDADGNEIYTKKRQVNYCDCFKKITNCFAECKMEHIEAMEQSKNLGEAYIAYCNGGVVYYTVCIDNSQFSGAIQGGPIHMTEPDVALIEMTASRYNASDNNKQELVELYKNIPVILPSTARYQLKLLNILANDISEFTKEKQKKTKEILDEQRSISEKLQEIKFLESMVSAESGYPINMETELKECIVKGNETEAKAILNEILGYIFFKHSGDNMQIIRMSVELVVVMSRAAVEGGARYEDVSKLTSDMFSLAADTKNIEEICLKLTKAVEKMILLVFPIKTDKSDQKSILRKAIIYINRNIQNDIKLEDVAKHVSLSPTYFSKLFSNEMKVTYIDYINEIKIKESKKFLADNKISLGEIAIKLGFTDQSYFTKVFKKHTGITPGKYRKRNF